VQILVYQHLWSRDGTMNSMPTTPVTATRAPSSFETEGSSSNRHLPHQQSEEEFQEDLERALSESVKLQSRRRANAATALTDCIVLDASDTEDDDDDIHRKIPRCTRGDATAIAVKTNAFNNVPSLSESVTSLSRRRTTTTTTDCIELDSSDTDDDDGDDDDTGNDDRKLPAITNDAATDADVAAKKNTFNDASSVSNGLNAGEEDERDILNEAIRHSLEEAKSAKQRSLNDGRDEDDENIPNNICRRLTRQELQEAVDEFVHQQGGYDRIEKGHLIKHGNSNDMNKSCIAGGGGRHQTAAQYGRYSILAMWRVFDVLEGKADISIGNNSQPSDGSDGSDGNRLVGLPGAKITAFVDIGHGIGIQVLQAGWCHGVPSRGVEIMKDRHLVAVSIQDGVIESLRSDPPDSMAVELRHADFSLAMVPDRERSQRDTELHSYLLFKDKSTKVQEGLVIFINNAEDVFAARSNQNAKGMCLDAYLAKMFAQMQIGGRMVTLTDVSCHLNQSADDDWFRHDIFDSGVDAVSWGYRGKSVDVHILTKLSNTWYCQNKKCNYMKYYATASCYQEDSFSTAGAPNDVVNEFGELNEECIYCQETASASARRSSRFRNQASKRKK
jgi:hypothetical protein